MKTGANTGAKTGAQAPRLLTVDDHSPSGLSTGQAWVGEGFRVDRGGGMPDPERQ